MARQLKWWVGATLVACVLIVVTHVPPRGARPEPTSRRQALVTSAARVRAQALADRWRAAERTLRLAEYRRGLEDELARRRAANEPGAALVIEGADSLPDASRRLLRTALDTVWQRLGLGVTKVAVGLVVDVGGGGGKASSTDRPRDDGGAPAYLLPDSLHRSTCLALLPARYLSNMVRQSQARIEEWLRSGLGPCGFYAAYGTPGSTVRRWLARRNYDLARYPDWGGEVSSNQRLSWPMMNPNTGRWWWDAVYSVPRAGVACLAGRPEACRAAVLQGAGDRADDSLPPVVVSERWWWQRERLVQGYRYLADVAREVGRDRFLRFWNSPLPVDSSLALALKAPVGEWTARWERRFAPPLTLGAAAPWSATLLGILFAGAAVLTVVLTASRREVR